MKFEKRLALTGYLRKTFGVSDIHDKASIRRYYKRFNEDATGAAYDASGISKVCNVLRAISRVSVSEEKLLEYDRNIRRSEEHTSELQSRGHLVCRLLLAK